MRLSLSLLCSLLLLSTSAAAEVFTGRGGLHFSLSRGSVSSPEDSDLEVTSTGVLAKYGVKRSSRGGNYEAQEVTALGEPYDLKDAAGGKWRMWIRTALDQVVSVEIIRAPRRMAKTDRVFNAVAVTIDGAQAHPTFSQLVLFANGTYLFGRVRGKYKYDEGGVTLDGTPGQWGRGAYTLNSDGLIFRFSRGHVVYEVKYEQQVNVAVR